MNSGKSQLSIFSWIIESLLTALFQCHPQTQSHSSSNYFNRKLTQSPLNSKMLQHKRCKATISNPPTGPVPPLFLISLLLWTYFSVILFLTESVITSYFGVSSSEGREQKGMEGNWMEWKGTWAVSDVSRSLLRFQIQYFQIQRHLFFYKKMVLFLFL